ncbi:CoA transferase [Streptomyces sp. NPDC049541]|uniref:CoA transferase n=1 Tax=Streptomyces sp. NPDC049541 TaxID=3365594 RepID=UPI003787DF27
MPRGRHSVAANLKDTAGVRTVLALIQRAGALIKGFRPGATERLGLAPTSAWNATPPPPLPARGHAEQSSLPPPWPATTQPCTPRRTTLRGRRRFPPLHASQPPLRERAWWSDA